MPDKFELKDHEAVINEAITTIGTERLKPLKEALPENVTYFDIKYYIVKNQKEN